MKRKCKKRTSQVSLCLQSSKKQRILEWILFCLTIVLFSGCAQKPKQYSAVGTAMGTVIHQKLLTPGEDITDEILQVITSLEQETLSYRIENSEIGKLNAQAGSGNQLTISEELNQDLTICKDVFVKSDGDFDVTVGPLTRLWNIDEWATGNSEELCIPSKGQIDSALLSTGFDKLQFAEGKLLLPEGMSLDLGAVGKGIACDRIADYLYSKKVEGAVISVGGSILTYGEKENGEPWTVGIVNPKDTADSIGKVSLRGKWFVSTSGDYERYMEVDGRKYHHMLDPHTGYPADSGLSSVTIVCDSGVLSDALSTACFVLGKEKGMKLAEEYKVAALFIDKEGNLTMNKAMESMFH